MSLFKTRELWSTTASSSSEIFDQHSLVVSNIDANSDSALRLITANQSGVLRIYAPRADKNEDGLFIGFKPDDLLLEVQLSLPILQIAVGKYVSSADQDHLAVLHPRKLSIYSVTSQTGASEYGSQFQLFPMYEHNLQRSAYNMVCGPFGGTKGRDFFCVQSLDGTLSFFEQESFAFSRFLPKFLLPGPIQYIPRTDSFVTVSSSYQLECYKYQVLAVAADSKTKEESENIKQGKRVSADWFYSLGEQAVDLSVCNFKGSMSTILVLGDRHIFCLKDTGVLRFLIKLDYGPAAFFPYQADVDGNLMYMVATQTKTLLVYKEATLQWAAQLPFTPVCFDRISINDINGVICGVSEEGELACMYLGTDPSLFTAPTVTSPSLNYEQTDKEMAELYKIIKASQKPSAENKAKNIEQMSDLQLNVSLAENLSEMPDHISPVYMEGVDKIPCLIINIKLSPDTHLSNLRLSISVTKPLEVSQPVSDYKHLGQSAEIDCYVYMRYAFVPYELKATILVVFNKESGKQRLMSHTVDLPLSLVVKACVPNKDLPQKLTLDMKQSLPPLTTLFPKYCQENSESSTTAVGVRIFGGHEVAIFSAKSSNRYRIQASCHEALWLMLDQLIKALHNHSNKKMNNYDCPLSFSGTLPLKDCFKLIDAHHECRLLAHKLQDQLCQSASQYRAIQKRLLAKFKDKTPSLLTNLDVLLETTHKNIMDETLELEKTQEEIEKLSSSLRCSICIIHQLIHLQGNVKQDIFQLFCSAFSPNVYDNIDQQIGWEEMTDCALNYLLKTYYGKNKDGSSSIPTAIMKDTTGLKRHLAQVIDKLSNKDVVVNSNEDDQALTVVPEEDKFDNRLRPSIDSSTAATNASNDVDQKSAKSDDAMEF